MTLEKLQLIATSAMEPEYKVRWLKWWNSGSFNREAKVVLNSCKVAGFGIFKVEDVPDCGLR
jgi:hypothetical protein